jgi:beta-galactosidase
MRRLCAEAGIPTIEVGDDVDVVMRSAADRAVTIVINHRDEPLVLAGLALAGVDLVSGSEVASGSTVVPAGGVIAVLTERSES